MSAFFVVTVVLLPFVFCGRHGNSSIQVTIGCNDKVLNKVTPEFLSVGLDCSLIRRRWKDFDTSSAKILTLARGLSPAVLRMGGTDCDFAIFQPDNEFGKKDHTNFTFSGDDWIKLNKFSLNAGWRLLFDVNVLLRKSDGSWDSKNAKKLLDFNDKLGYQLDFQLGNEPNLFTHVSNISVSPTALAKDFKTFRSLLERYSFFKNGKVVGPDTTRPNVHLGSSPIHYLKGFLQGAAATVDAVTWHQYYLNGRIATADDFTNTSVLNLLPKQIHNVQKVVNKYKPGSQIWLTETSSAYGGGAKGLSDKYIAGFLWLDKLGVAAKQGLSVVIRQTFFHGSYSMLDPDSNPNPDYWLSLLYKRLVGQVVLDLHLNTPSENMRFYAHCMNGTSGGVTLYGLNLDKKLPASIHLTGLLSNQIAYEYLLQPYDHDLTSGAVMLNGAVLHLTKDETLPKLSGRRLPVNTTIILPPLTFAFYTIPSANLKSCRV